MKFKFVAVFVVVLLGIVIGVNHSFITEHLKLLISKSIEKNNVQYDEIDPIFYKTDIQSLIHINNENNVTDTRNRLIQYMWKSSVLPYDRYPVAIQYDINDTRYDDMQNMYRIDKIIIKMDYGIESYAYL